jgi:IS1 family transposase
MSEEKKIKYGCGLLQIKGFHRILAWVNGDRSAATFEPLWKIIRGWKSFLYSTLRYVVYTCFIDDGDHLVKKTYMTRVEGENTRLRHYLAIMLGDSCAIFSHEHITFPGALEAFARAKTFIAAGLADGSLPLTIDRELQGLESLPEAMRRN